MKLYYNSFKNTFFFVRENAPILLRNTLKDTTDLIIVGLLLAMPRKYIQNYSVKHFIYNNSNLKIPLQNVTFVYVQNFRPPIVIDFVQNRLIISVVEIFLFFRNNYRESVQMFQIQYHPGRKTAYKT